ncbi:MAG: phosphoribosylformylglycinamidine synthase subunit PurQ [Clostridiales bacterium]|nr:phosphoribosylformylglycinamidine synthase subunit PurQ [Clostridiales bacterium]
MHWNGKEIVNLSRAFLNSNGAVKHAAVSVPQGAGKLPTGDTGDVKARFLAIAKDPNTASQRGLGERFDASIGAGSVLFPYGGKRQLTPAQAMVGLLPVGPGRTTDTCSIMASGFDPMQMAADPFYGAQCSVVESVAKVVAAGGDVEEVYLTFQEYFERLRQEPERWGKPFAALLGAYQAQIGLGCAAIGGKDSMSGSFMDLDVPPTLVSFAIAPGKVGEIVSNEFKAAGNPVYLFEAPEGDYEGTKAVWNAYRRLLLAGKVRSSFALTSGGVAEALMKMSFGNGVGFAGEEDVAGELLFGRRCGSIVAELTEDVGCARKLGVTTADGCISVAGVTMSIDELDHAWEGTLEGVYPTDAKAEPYAIPNVDCGVRPNRAPAARVARPRAVIPVFPGTNCEYDTANACLRAGIQPEIVVVRNLTTDLLLDSANALEQAIRNAQMIALPGGFSGGDEPEGSGKFIASFFRNGRIQDAVHDLLKNRDGLMLGICNGFQALVKLGLVPYGEIRDMDDTCPTLTFNLIGRHQSRYCDTRVASVHSPWMLKSQVGQVYSVPVSHGEGRFVAPAPILEQMVRNGQIATQYVDGAGVPSLDISANPNGSVYSIEGIFSPDGRVFGKMGHTERWNPGVGLNIPGEKLMPIFESGAEYFK